MFKQIALLAAVIPTIAIGGAVEDFERDLNLQFNSVSKDVIGSMSHRTVIPAEPLGVVGFDLGVSFNKADLNSILKNHTYAGLNALDSISVHANKGLPLGFDIGVNYSKSAILSTINGSISYALLDGGVAMPAVNIKGTYTSSLGSDVIDFSSYGADLGISKGFTMFTPFASIGMVNGEVKAKRGTVNRSYSENVMRYAIGANVNFFIGNLVLAYNNIGEVSNMTVKLGFRF